MAKKKISKKEVKLSIVSCIGCTDSSHVTIKFAIKFKESYSKEKLGQHCQWYWVHPSSAGGGKVDWKVAENRTAHRQWEVAENSVLLESR